MKTRSATTVRDGSTQMARPDLLEDDSRHRPMAGETLSLPFPRARSVLLVSLSVLLPPTRVNCTALSLITRFFNGNTVRNFPTHGKLSAAQSPTSCLNFDFAILNLFDPRLCSLIDGPEVEHGAHFLILYYPPRGCPPRPPTDTRTTAGRYLTSDEHHLLRLKKTIVIQRFSRGWFARRRARQVRKRPLSELNHNRLRRVVELGTLIQTPPFLSLSLSLSRTTTGVKPSLT
jgi:hypothetical protein